MEHIDALIQRLRATDDDDVREAIQAELIELAKGPEGSSVREHLESVARREVLEVQWALEEVVEAATPKKDPPPPPPKAAEVKEESPKDAPKRGRLDPRDLEMVYQDPRGLAIHRTKDGKRWFLTQVDPYTGQPLTRELNDSEITQLKGQLGIFS
ncbi:MAG: hypothetical protein H6740_26110 [Alphaproteobacteria bacterium]|nr:hypothetical protein [Alphaproteobacteria bacterium]